MDDGVAVALFPELCLSGYAIDDLLLQDVLLDAVDAAVVAVAEAIAEMPEVDYVVITAGTYDLLIETVCEDNEALLRFLTEKLRAIEGVRETETFVYLRMVKQTYQWGTR